MSDVGVEKVDVEETGEVEAHGHVCGAAGPNEVGDEVDEVSGLRVVGVRDDGVEL